MVKAGIVGGTGHAGVQSLNLRLDRARAVF
jgi:hypothetical protein